MSKHRGESLFWGIILLLVGVLFLIQNLGIDIDIWNIFMDYWPTILIAIGIKNIIVYIRQKK